MDQYFATLPREQIGKELFKKIDSWNEYLETTGTLNELRKSYATFYGDTSIRDVGIQGELKKVHVNQYGNLLRHLHSMITQQKPAFQCQSTNTDMKSQSQTILAQGILDYVMREKRIDRALREATEAALFLREGWVSTQWEFQTGEIYGIDPDTQQPQFEGDLDVRIHLLPDVIREPDQFTGQSHTWLILRTFRNKYDLAAKYPDLAEQILSLKVDQKALSEYRINAHEWAHNSEHSSDSIPYYIFFHEKTAACPLGRVVEFISPDVILPDGPLPYKRIPLFRVSPEQKFETALGHSPMLDLLPLQDAFDSLISTAVTNQSAFGVQNLVSEKGSGLSVTKLNSGMNVYEINKGSTPPQPLQLLQTSPEVFNFMGQLATYMENLSGINSVVRGDAPASLSGAAMALLAQQSLQFSSGTQQSYNSLLEDVGTSIIYLYAQYADRPRVAHIVGKHNRSLVKQFTKQDLQNISRVTIDQANPLSKTASGRIEIANNLLAQKLITDGQQYLMVLQTGQLEPMIESETSLLLLIREENEALMDGQGSPVIMSDDHGLHVREHLSVLDSMEARKNPKVTQMVLAHVQEHINAARSADPMLLMILGRQPLQLPMQQGTPAPNQGTQSTLDPSMPVTQQAEQVGQPNMPIVAGTDQTFNPVPNQ